MVTTPLGLAGLYRRLFCAVSDELSKLPRNNSDDVESVMKWVEMENITNKERGQEVEAKKRSRSPSRSKSKSTPKSPLKFKSPMKLNARMCLRSMVLIGAATTEEALMERI